MAFTLRYLNYPRRYTRYSHNHAPRATTPTTYDRYGECGGTYQESRDVIQGRRVWDRLDKERFIYYYEGAWMITASSYREKLILEGGSNAGLFSAAGGGEWYEANWAARGGARAYLLPASKSKVGFRARQLLRAHTTGKFLVLSTTYAAHVRAPAPSLSSLDNIPTAHYPPTPHPPTHHPPRCNSRRVGARQTTSREITSRRSTGRSIETLMMARA